MKMDKDFLIRRKVFSCFQKQQLSDLAKQGPVAEVIEQSVKVLQSLVEFFLPQAKAALSSSQQLVCAVSIDFPCLSLLVMIKCYCIVIKPMMSDAMAFLEIIAPGSLPPVLAFLLRATVSKLPTLK